MILLVAEMRGNWCTIAKVENNFNNAFGNNVFFSKRRQSVNLPNGMDDILHVGLCGYKSGCSSCIDTKYLLFTCFTKLLTAIRY